jgi:TolB-like protein/Flp pilus assembly protein TadD
MPETRKHAAIMFTDIVGYTRLMGTDEQKAVDMLSRNRSIHQSCIEKFNGTFIKEIGDGILASFSLASDAVRSAIEIQKECKEQGIPLKIGIHEGEMIFSGSDVIGDVVNIASRLQEDAQEGCINISASVYSNIRNKADIQTKLVGEKLFKNVDDPVKAYEVLCDVEKETQEGLPEKSSNKLPYYIIAGIAVVIIAFLIWQFLPDKESIPVAEESETTEIDRSIAVLPFTNMSNDPDQEYFSDGMMEEILLHLYKIGDLEVTSRTSSEKYGDTDKLIGEIANELGVRHILEGSVRKVGDRVRITAQLIDAVNDKHLWAESYDEELKDVFTIQSNIAEKIAISLKAEISPELKKRIERIPTKNTEAYNLFLQARYFMNYEYVQMDSGKILLEKAISLDPNFAEVYVELAYYWFIRGAYAGSVDSKIVSAKALPLLTKAIEINEDLAIAHMQYANYYLWYKWDFQNAEREYIIYHDLAPSATILYSSYGDMLLATGRFNEALEVSEEYLRNDPNNFTNWTFNALSHCFSNHTEKAVHQLETVLKLFPQNIFVISTAMRIYIILGMYEKAKESYDKFINLTDLRFPRLMGNLAIACYHTGEKDKTENILKELIAKSDTTSVGSPAFYTAMIYSQMEETDLAFEYVEKAYDAHEVEMYWLKVEPPFEPLHDDPRWQVMLDKVGFPD